MRDRIACGRATPCGKARFRPGGAGVVFALKRPYCGAVNGGAPPTGLQDRAGHELHHRAHHRPAPVARPAPHRREFPPEALHGLHQLEALARGAQRHGPARPHRRGPARPAPRSCGGHGRSRQHRHAGGIPPRRGVDGDARRPARRELRARQPRRLCARGDADPERDLREMDDRRYGRIALPLSARARRRCDHRPDLGACRRRR